MAPAVFCEMDCLASTPAGGSPASRNSVMHEQPNSSSTILSAVLGRIQSHIGGDSEKPLVLHLPGHIARSTVLQEALRGVSYEFEDGRLYIRARPSDLHVTCSTWFTNTYIHRIVPWLTPRERDGGFLNLETREVRLPGLVASNNFMGRPRQGRKIPDGAVVLEEPDGSTQERIILETGFTQGLEELYDDKNDWLLKSRSVMLVLLIKIDEDTNSLRRHQRSDTFQQRLHAMMMARAVICQEGISPDEDSDELDIHTLRMTSEAFEDRIAQDIVVDDWVGPLTAHLEAWERSKDGCRPRGTPVQLLPSSPTTHSPPQIKITDLISPDQLDPAADQSRFVLPDFEDLKQRILRATKSQALSRAIDRLA